MRLIAYTDGASRGNPGESGIGFVLKDEKGLTVFEGGGYIGQATNNIAEYSALLACLRKACETGCSHLAVHSDSELMVRQLQGRYKVRDSKLQEYFRMVRALLETAPFEVTFTHVERSDNSRADKLANMGIDSKVRLQI
jgi:ribonuclease HI